MIDDAHEWFALVKFADGVDGLLFAQLGEWLAVAGGENAAIHRHEVRREDHLNLVLRHRAQDLLDLGRVPMTPDVVGGNALIALREMRGELGRAASPRYAALGVHDDVM